MKLALIGASALSLLMAPAAFAADVSMSVGGTVASACGVGFQSGGGPHAPTTSVTLGNIADGNGFLAVADQEINFGNIWCNKGAQLTMNVTKLSTPTVVTDTGSFKNSFDMEVTDGVPNRGVFVYFGSNTKASSADASPLTYTLNQEFETGGNTYAKAKLHVVPPGPAGGNDRPVAGTYSGSVTLNVTPNS